MDMYDYEKDCFNCTYSHLYSDILKCTKFDYIEVDEDNVCEYWEE